MTLTSSPIPANNNPANNTQQRKQQLSECDHQASTNFTNAINSANNTYNWTNLATGTTVTVACLGGASCPIALTGGALVTGFNHWRLQSSTNSARTQFQQEIDRCWSVYGGS